jgi:hypothetical protein
MENYIKDVPPQSSMRRRFQFSLRTLFIFSFLVALFSAGIFSHYTAVQLWTNLLWLLIYQAILLSLAIYGKGYLRTFCIGATVSFTLMFIPQFMLISEIFSDLFRSNRVFDFTAESSSDGDYFLPAICIAIEFVGSVIFGGTMVVTRWLIDSSQRQEQVERQRPVLTEVLPEEK